MSDRLLALIAGRQSKREFLPEPVPRDVLERVLTAARHAPSGRNLQPWKVAVVSGAARDALSHELCERFDAGEPLAAGFANRPPELSPAETERAATCGAGMLAARGVDRDDVEGRQRHVRRNFEFHGAPVELIFHLDAAAVPGGFLALGCYLQNVMLGLLACDYGSCPQYSVAGYPDVIRRHLRLPADEIVVCGLAVGVADPASAINRFSPDRAPLDEFVQWFP